MTTEAMAEVLAVISRSSSRGAVMLRDAGRARPNWLNVLSTLRTLMGCPSRASSAAMSSRFVPGGAADA